MPNEIIIILTYLVFSQIPTHFDDHHGNHHHINKQNLLSFVLLQLPVPQNPFTNYYHLNNFHGYLIGAMHIQPLLCIIPTMDHS